MSRPKGSRNILPSLKKLAKNEEALLKVGLIKPPEKKECKCALARTGTPRILIEASDCPIHSRIKPLNGCYCDNRRSDCLKCFPLYEYSTPKSVPIPSNRVFNFPIKTFNPDNLLDEMLNADENTVFVLGEKEIKHTKGDSDIELTFVQIKKSKSYLESWRKG